MVLSATKTNPETWVLLGASRGLGLSFHQWISKHNPEIQVHTFSRKINGTDFSKQDQWPSHVEKIKALQPTRVIYFAAGGPYANYSSREWKDQEWALKVTFLFPAYLLHNLLADSWNKQARFFKQLVFIGSSVAEANPDPLAAMYCASKHALRGLISSVQSENPEIDVKLFSPGYMDTSMLPPNAWPRKQGLAKDPKIVAEELFHFMTQSALEP